MITHNVEVAVLVVAGSCCFAMLVPFEDPSSGHFLVLSKAYEFNSTEKPPLLGTLVALLFDRYSGSEFKIQWPQIQPPLVQPKATDPTLPLSKLFKPQSPAVCHPDYQARACNLSVSPITAVLQRSMMGKYQ